MCVGVPGRIVGWVDADRLLAHVEAAGSRRTVHTGLLRDDGLEIGDWVLIHVGIALSRIDEAEARAVYALLEAMDGAERDGTALEEPLP